MRPALLALVLLAADTNWGFHPGTGPVDSPLWGPSAERCAECHPTEYAAWSVSRHRVSWTNPIFQQEWSSREPQLFCVYCHAPLAGQSAKILYDEGSGVGPEEGITCVTCHLRKGVMLGLSGEGGPHPARAEPGLQDPAFCASCHDFDTPGVKDPAEPMQATAREAAGSAERCVDCHMPGGDHRFLGGHDLGMLRGALAVTVERRGEGLVFTLLAQGTAHAFPTGDLFRHLTVEVQEPDGAWTVLAWLGRRLELVKDPRTGAVARRTVLDSRLWPGEPLEVHADHQGSSWRIRMHYAPDDSPLPEELRVALVAEGVLPASAP